jgi:predicted nucleic acid-binding protein
VQRVYLDSCIVIYLLQAAKPIREAVHGALFPTANPAPQAYISPLTRLECRVWPLREQQDELLELYDRFFSSRDLRRVRWTTEVFDRATELRAQHRIKTPDTLHLAAAITSDCDEFWTNDQRLPEAIREPIPIRILP